MSFADIDIKPIRDTFVELDKNLAALRGHL